MNNVDLAALWAEHWPSFAAFGLRAVGALVVLIIGLRVAAWRAGA